MIKLQYFIYEYLTLFIYAIFYAISTISERIIFGVIFFYLKYGLDLFGPAPQI